MKKTYALTALSILSSVALHAQENNTTINGYKPNNIQFNILSATDHGVGGGITYDRILDKNGNVELTLPVSIISDAYENNSYEYNNNKARVYFMPGIKFYPSGVKRNSFALGPSLVYSYYKGNDNGYYSNRGEYTNQQLGIIMKAYYQMNITPMFNFNVNGGLGILYMNDYKYKSNAAYNFSEGISALANINIGFGIRF